MKKQLLWSLLFLCSFVGVSKADIMVSSKEEPVLVTFSSYTVLASTSFVLVDLPAVSSYPHLNNGQINIVSMNISIDKVAANVGTVKIGVLTEVNQATGTVKYFIEKPFSRETTQTQFSNSTDLNHFFARCKVSIKNGQVITPYIASNDISYGRVEFNSTSLLQSPVGLVNPHIGDVVIVVTTTGGFDLVVTSLYLSEPK